MNKEQETYWREMGLDFHYPYPEFVEELSIEIWTRRLTRMVLFTCCVLYLRKGYTHQQNGGDKIICLKKK